MPLSMANALQKKEKQWRQLLMYLARVDPWLQKATGEQREPETTSPYHMSMKLLLDQIIYPTKLHFVSSKEHFLVKERNLF